MNTLMFTRNFGNYCFVSASHDMSNSDCRLSVFNRKHLEEPLLTPTHGKMIVQSQRVEALNTVLTCMFTFVYVQVTIVFAICLSPCVCLHTRGSIHKLLFYWITHSTVIVETYVLRSFLNMSINQKSTVHDVVFRFVFVAGWHWVAGIATSHNNSWWGAVIGKFNGHYSMAASARGVGSFASNRPGVTHLETPSTASAIR